MTEKEFLDTLGELIQEDATLTGETELKSLESWDSMAIMAVIAWFDVEQGKKVSFTDLEKLKTVGDLAALVPNLSR